MSFLVIYCVLDVKRSPIKWTTRDIILFLHPCNMNSFFFSSIKTLKTFIYFNLLRITRIYRIVGDVKSWLKEVTDRVRWQNFGVEFSNFSFYTGVQFFHPGRFFFKFVLLFWFFVEFRYRVLNEFNNIHTTCSNGETIKYYYSIWTSSRQCCQYDNFNKTWCMYTYYDPEK